MLHKNIFAKYWYEPSFTLSGTFSFQFSLSVNLSAAIPPAIPPITGIAPFTDKNPISEKISFEDKIMPLSASLLRKKKGNLHTVWLCF